VAAGEGASIGEVYVDLLPRFGPESNARAKTIGEQIGQRISNSLIDAIGRGIGEGLEKGSRQALPKATKAGSDTATAFERGFKARLTEALRSLPKAKLDADSTAADRAIAVLRAQIQSLRDAKIGVDIDAQTVVAKFNYIKSKLDELRGDDASIEVRAAVDQALASLDRVRVVADEVAAKNPTVDVDANTTAAKVKLDEVEIKADEVAAKSPTVEVDADTAGATAELAAVGGAAQISATGMQGLIAAGISLAPAIIPAAAAATAAIGSLGAVAFAAGSAIGVAALAIVPVIAAVKAMSDAEGQAGTSAASSASRQLQMASAIDQVRSARAALANTTANVAASEARAAEQVSNAERNLSQAQAAALRAQQSLNDAREAARRSLEDLNNQVADNAIAQRRANLQLADARAALAAVQGLPADNRQRVEAQLAYDEAQQQVLELGQKQKELAADRDAANKKGIDGSAQVVAAQRNIAQANEQVRKAEQAVADARTAQAEQARQNAFSIAQAQQAVVNAQRAVQQASVSAGTEGSAAMNKLNQAMGALSPAGRAFAEFLFSLKPILTALSQAAQTGFLPGLQRGIQALLPVMPQVTAFVGALAQVMGDLAEQALTALASPWWQQFFAQMGAIAIPLLRQVGPLFLNLAQAVAALFLAFAPFAPQIIGWLVQLSERFAAWATSLSGNSGFQAFVDYVNRNGPMLVDLLGRLALIALKLLIAFAPLGEIMLKGALAVASFLAKLSPGQLIAIAAGIGLITLAILALVGGPVTVVVAAGVAIAGAFAYAYTHIQIFKQVTDTVFQGWLTWMGILIDIAKIWWTVASTVWTGVAESVVRAYNFIRPVLDGIGFVIKDFLIPILLFFWHNVIEPAWQGIGVVINIAAAGIQIAFGLIQIGLKILGAAFRALYDFAIRPVWEGQIRPLLQSVGDFVRDRVAPAFQAGLDAISRAWAGLREAARVPVAFVVNHVVNPLINGYNDLARIFHVDTVNPIPGFATGGFISGPGGPRDDAILARLSAGEYVIPAHVVAAWGVEFFDHLIGRRGVPGVTRPGDGSRGIALPAFADGGLVGFFKDAWAAVTDPVGLIKRPVDAAISRIPGAGVLTTLIANMGHRLVDGLLGWIHGVSGGSAPGDIGKAQAFVKAQAGKPYGWAMAGPDFYDCSGIVSAAYLVAHGKNPYNHLFSTSNEAGYFPVAGRGAFTAGWANPGERGGGSVGHTAANIAGLAFESVGSQGVRIGSSVTPLTSFAHLGHYDTGGILPPGLTIARNDTGRDEYVLRADQMAALAGTGRRGGVRDITVPVYGSTASPHEIAQMVKHELAWELR
jgi:hypothetical protein